MIICSVKSPSGKTILLMTMLDIAINLTSTNEYKKGHRSIWRKIIEYLKS